MKKVDKKLLKKEKELLGNGYIPLAENWSIYLGVTLTPKDVAMMLAQDEDIQIKFIQDKLNNLRDQTGFLINNNLQEAFKIYKELLERSQKAKDIHLFVATNYNEYLKL